MESAYQPGEAREEDLVILESYLESIRQGGGSEKTIIAYKRDCRHFLRFVAREKKEFPEDIDYHFLRRYAAHLSRFNYQKSSISRKLSSVRGLFRFCRFEGLIETSPAESLSSPKQPDKLPTVLRPAEVEAFLDSIDVSKPLGLRDRAIFELMYGCGLRSKEVVNLELQSLDLDNEELRVKGKGERDRTIPVGEMALFAVREYLQKGRPELIPQGNKGDNIRNRGAIFLSVRGNPLGTSDIRRRTTKYVRKASVNTNTSSHVFRHCFATHLIEGGADLRAVQELLGHAALSTTQRYTQVSGMHLRRVYEKSHPRAR